MDTFFSKDMKETIYPLEVGIRRMGGLVTLPNEFLNLLVELICEGSSDVLLKWEWVVNCIYLDKIFRILAEESLLTEFHVDLDLCSLKESV